MIFIFGGAFNPPTKAHYEIAKHILNDYTNSKLVFLPVGNIYNKANLIKDEIRFEMLDLMIKDLGPNVCVSDFEMHQPKFKGTINTLDHFKELYNDEVYFIIGSDNIIDMENWIDVERLLSNYKIVILNRDNINVKNYISNSLILRNYINSFIFIEGFKQIDISSSQFRMTRDFSLLTPEITQYIKEHNLY